MLDKTVAKKLTLYSKIIPRDPVDNVETGNCAPHHLSTNNIEGWWGRNTGLRKVLILLT